MPVNELKADILRKYASVHDFCKAHPELPRSSVYLLLSGKYPGNGKRQAARLRAALSGQKAQKRELPQVSASMISESLQAIRCANCRRLNRRECLACRDQTAREAGQLFSRLYGSENPGEATENTGP